VQCNAVHSFLHPLNLSVTPHPSRSQPHLPQHAYTTTPTDRPAACDDRVRDLHFAYPNRPDVEVLRGVSLEIEPGQVAAVVGASGAGKSTLLALLLGLYAPSEGSLSLDGHEVGELDPTWLREQLGLVEQEPALFTGTIAENIRYGSPEASDAAVEAAARAAGAHDFIGAFPEGYATPVGERGRAQLSGGEKQRVTLARALAKDPPVLVLDEATSALDRESERAVQAALERANAVGGRTVVLVAHRLSTVEKADRIFVLAGGKVVESGTFAELMAREDSHFVRLHQAAASTGSLLALAGGGAGAGAGTGAGAGAGVGAGLDGRGAESGRGGNGKMAGKGKSQ
jgi:ABC-type multidrug transport system fused ATPase/permease subunit